ncbi:MAG: AAA family ATPase [bacterium]|nr:AAA family ATPase [bacterium]
MTIDKIPEEWVRLVKDIEEYHRRFIIFTLGENDTGKSTLCRYLVSQICHLGRRVAWIDSDLGQSILGPPATVGMRIVSPTEGEESPLFLRFVGSTSPIGHLLQTLVAVRTMMDKAIRQRVDGIVLDTCGFVTGRIGLEFKFQKIDLVNPTHLIALQKGRELEVLLRNFSYRRSLSLRRFPISEAVQPKSTDQRWEYRQEQFRKYFHEAKVVNFAFAGLGLHGHLPDFQSVQHWQGLLIGFCDEMNDTLALGIIQEVDLKRKQFSCLTPLQPKQRVRSIQFGSLHLDSSGRELILKK